MPKFYHHSIQDSRDLSESFHTKISSDLSVDPRMAEYQILQLEHIAEHGLPDCYEQFTDFLFDFYPDFAWTETHQHIQINIVLNDPRMISIFKSLQDEWNYDLKQELKSALTE